MKFIKITATAMLSLTSLVNAGDKIVCEGSSTVGPIAKAFAEYYMEKNKDVAVTVSESGSGNGAKAIVSGSCDVANMSRNIKAKEFKAAADKGIQVCPHVVALDGIAIVVHKSNPVKDLTLAQVKEIYLGKISNWSQIGGPNKKIVVITRDTNSGTFETFNKLVMQKSKIVNSAEVVGSNGQSKSRVLATPASIGFVGIGYIDGLKPLNINGVEVSTETIRDGSYPIARPLFMYTNGYPKLGTHLHRFISLFLTEDGQEMVEEIGFVPVTDY